MYGEERERLLYPDVIVAQDAGEGPDGRPPIRYTAKFTTNNMDTVVRGYVYWYTPEGEEPVLMIEIDDEDLPGGADNMDIKIRVRRNDGLIYEGTQASQENIKEE
jgi:hypothetical protein